MAMQQNITLIRGKTYAQVLRWEDTTLVYKAITAITQAAPVSITATAHGVKDGWRVAVVSAGGMTDINARYSPPAASDYQPAAVVDVNTIELNKVNSSGYDAYTSGGYLVYKTPINLSSYTARMQIRQSAGGTLYETLTTENGGITLDATENTISLLISDSATEAYTWSRGKYDLEMISPAGRVYLLMRGNVRVESEVTV